MQEDSKSHTESDWHSPLSVEERFQRVVEGFRKPKNKMRPSGFHGITIKEKNEREIAVRELVKLGLSIRQIKDFLPSRGIFLSDAQVYGYYERLGLKPSVYRKYEQRYKDARKQSPHDRYCKDLLVRLARDAGTPITEIELNQAAYQGARFRPDIRFMVGNYRFCVEVQLEPLPESRWTLKLKNYIKYREMGYKDKILFFVRSGDMTRIRQYARDLLKQHGMENSSVFRFIRMNEAMTEPGGTQNLMEDRLWSTEWSGLKKDRVSLLEYMCRSGQKPHMQN